MITNYIKIAWRQILKNKTVSFINIIGLGLGLTLGLFILLFVKNEFSYDDWIDEQANIYRVYRPYNGGTKGTLSTPGPLVNALREEVPGVSKATRVGIWGDALIESNKSHYSIEKVWSVDSAFFQTIPLDFKYGNPATVGSKLDQVVFSPELTNKMFGTENPIGKRILLENSRWLEIAGVLKEQEGPSHIQADMFVIEELRMTAWTGGGGYTYVRLLPEVQVEDVSQSIYQIAKREIVKESVADNEPVPTKFSSWKLQAITDIHLEAEKMGEASSARGSVWQITLMALIGLLVLILAIVNYINLITAQTNLRTKEIGIRSVTGANRGQLISQFLIEASVHISLALIAALFFAPYLMPYFNETVSRGLDYTDLFYGEMPFLILGLAILIGLTSGLFPALYWSGIRPVESLKKRFFKNKQTGTSRSAMIVGQFALTIGLVLFVVLVWQQIDFMLQKDLGFQGEQILSIRINQDETVDNFQSSKTQLEQIKGVESVTQISRIPGGFIPNYTLEIEGYDQRSEANMIFADYDWNEVFQVPLIEGRFFSNDFVADSTKSFVVNEAFVDKYQLNQPIGHRLKFRGDETYSTIIGVVKDFHYKGMESIIEPLVFCSNKEMAWMGNAAIRLNTDDLSSTIEKISETWKGIEPVFPVSYRFIDEHFAAQYKSYLRFGKQMTYAMIICLVIALSGLFGLTLFIIQRRRKEIGIRKVLGASIPQIIALISKDFIKLVLIAVILASPIAWYFISDWLDNFAYQIEIHWSVFILIGMLMLFAVFVVVGVQSLRSALANPVESIRNE